MSVLKASLQQPGPDGIGLSGDQFSVLVGPAFTLVFTTCGIPAGYYADRSNRKFPLALSLVLWSVATFLSGLCTDFTEMLLCRFFLGIAEAGRASFSASLIADYFPPASRGFALGVYNMGVYTGYSLALSAGSAISSAYGWRYVFFSFSLPGLLLSLLLLLFLKEPTRGGATEPDAAAAAKASAPMAPGIGDGSAASAAAASLPLADPLSEGAAGGDGGLLLLGSEEGRSLYTRSGGSSGGNSSGSLNSGQVNSHPPLPPPSREPSALRACCRYLSSFSEVLVMFATSPNLLLLCLAAGLRNAAGYCWAFNNRTALVGTGRVTLTQFELFSAWVPLVGGSVGAIVGGYVSDRVMVRYGASSRIWVLIASNLGGAPFAYGALVLPYPWCFLSLIPNNVIGEMWIGVALAVLVEMVPLRLRTASIATFYFIITNIGGNMPVAVPFLSSAFSGGARGTAHALVVLYAGMYVISTPFFVILALRLRCCNNTAAKRGGKEEEDDSVGYQPLSGGTAAAE